MATYAAHTARLEAEKIARKEFEAKRLEIKNDETLSFGEKFSQTFMLDRAWENYVGMQLVEMIKSVSK